MSNRKSLNICGIILCNPKHQENIGGVLRLAHNYSANFVGISGLRYKRHPADTPTTHNHIPIFHSLQIDNLFDFVPFDSIPIVIEITKHATDLCKFSHPNKAVYFFGPEDGSVPKSILQRCKYQVYIPTQNCMNLASTVACVLYDRMNKRQNNV